jgi:PASTA domain
MSNNPQDFIKDIMSEPLGNLIASIGKGVGEAQAALDAGSLNQTLEIYREDSTRPAEEQKMIELMRSIGYQPTFYVLPETEVEAQVSLSFNMNNTQTGLDRSNQLSRSKVYAMPINAGNTNKYNLNVNAFAKLKFKIVPVPTPADIIEMRIVPDLMSPDKMDAAAAEKLLTDLGLVYVLGESSPETGLVIGQEPAAGTRVKAGDTVTVTLSK